MNQEKRMRAPCEFGHENSRDGGDLGHHKRIGRFQRARIRLYHVLGNRQSKHDSIKP